MGHTDWGTDRIVLLRLYRSLVRSKLDYGSETVGSDPPSGLANRVGCLFEESESKVPPLGIRILPHLEKSKLNLNLIDDAPSLGIVPWKLSVPAVRFDLTSFKKDNKKNGNI